MNPLELFKEQLAKSTFGMTKHEAHVKGVCIDCKQAPDLREKIDRDEYRISGLCNKCFAKATGGDEY